jgi:ATP-binding cassette, subfamily B, bacterial
MFLVPYLKPYWKILLGVLILAMINQVFSLLDPQIFRWITDTYITRIDAFFDRPQELYRWIRLWLAMMVGTAMISRLAKNFQDYFANVMTQKMGMKIFSKTINHAFRLPYALLEDQSSWLLLGKLQKARTDIQTYILQLINVVFVAIVSLIFVISYAFFTHRLVGVFLVSLFPLMWIVSYSLSSKIKKAQEAIVQQSAILAWATTETIRNISLVKTLWLEGQELKRIEHANTNILDLELEKIRKVRSIEFIQGTLVNAIRVGMLWTMFWMIFKGYLTLGEFFSLFFYSFWVFAPLWQMGNVMKTYQEARASHNILQEITSQPILPEHQNPEHLDTIHTLTLKNISFHYPTTHQDINTDTDTDTNNYEFTNNNVYQKHIHLPQETTIHNQRTILDDINCSITAGQTIAFVWPSWTGKSTILKLLVWLYQPTTWTIYYNNKPLSAYALSDIAHHIGVVTQDPQLFSWTLRDNLTFVEPNASDEACLAVLQQAQLMDFLATQPHWLDTKIGEWWLKLSWWQKQRLAIARALLRNPDILMFDEATSSLDSMIEKEITQTIKEITKQRPSTITIMVAHRLSTIMHADTIIVLENGKISEQGTHQRLLEQHGLYYALRRQQTGHTQS